MSDFATESDVIAGLANAKSAGFRQKLYKATLTTANGFEYSGWMAGGAPLAGVAPTTWVHPTKATVGALNPTYINPGAGATCRVLAAILRPSVANQPVMIEDRVGHMAGLSGTSVAAQTVGATLTAAAADGRCAATGADVDWYLEWYSATGSTGINVTLAVTYNDDSTGNVVVAIPASVTAYRRYVINPAVAGKTIKAISTATNSATTGTAGNYGVTAIKRLFEFSVGVANTNWNADWAMTTMPDIGSNACLQHAVAAIGTAMGTLTGCICAGVK